ncbi:MAG: hypothetical protein OXB88_09800 [Bacteriovoracales bacterium]|nr:hypothetical protein [Bacteriovoracales bacterium]
MTLEEALVFLQNFVKESAVPTIRHISIDLVPAEKLSSFEKAMKTVGDALHRGELTRDNLLKRLRL